MNVELLSSITGLIGVMLTLVAYLLLQNKQLRSTDIRYSAMNASGASLILVSLCYDWNLASVIIELAWVLISCIGIYKSLISSNRTRSL